MKLSGLNFYTIESGLTPDVKTSDSRIQYKFIDDVERTLWHESKCQTLAILVCFYR